MLRVFRSNHHCPSKFHKFHWTTHVLESLFFLKIMKLYKDICSAWKSCNFAETFSAQIDVTNVSNRSIVILWRAGFLVSDLWKHQKKNIHFITNVSINTVTDILKFYEVLFCTYCKDLFCLWKTVIKLILLCIWIKHSQH